MSLLLVTIGLRQESDVVIARQRARQVAAHLGFASARQAQIGTAVSEIARNTVQHGGGGQLDLLCEPNHQPPLLLARLSDQGPGMLNSDGHGSPPPGAAPLPGWGLVSARRLADGFQVQSAPHQGTSVELSFNLPPGAGPMATRLDPAQLSRLRAELHPDGTSTLVAELHQQNRELAQLMQQLQQAQSDIADLNRELENTNRGVVALYAELDERAEQLRRADEIKTRFFSNMSHEFRTPVNSILALSQLLLDHIDGQLNSEQTKQVGFIRKAALDLGDLVGDLLDLAKVEAGRVTIRRATFELNGLFGTLRGLMRPLAINPEVALIFVEPANLPSVYNDESKVAQIMRNFISNALKFTERGEVRVFATVSADGRSLRLTVADTGIGIAIKDQERIFQEFGQVENAIQGRVKGTGLGLALSRRLADLLGGTIELDSQPGRGSTFTLSLSLATDEASARSGGAPGLEPAEVILVIDDDEITRYLLHGLLANQPAQIVEAASGRDGLRLAGEVRPDLIFLDIVMPDINGYEVLEQLRRQDTTRAVPIVVFTASSITDLQRQALDLAEVVDIVPKDLATREETQRRLDAARARAGEWRRQKRQATQA